MKFQTIDFNEKNEKNMHLFIAFGLFSGVIYSRIYFYVVIKMMKIACSILLSIGSVIVNAQGAQPKLILQLVIDQLRGDLIHQHQQQFGPSGFNYLLKHGIYYHNAHHPHANTTTCAGHATIATGSYPSLHGVVDNEWYDRATKKVIYCMEDLNSSILPTPHSRTVIPGRSPNNLNGSTIGDEIRLSNTGKVFAVSLKDRSAITLAGHTGKAFWFDKTNGGFITSSYYYSNYPAWVQNWNKLYEPKAFEWKLGEPMAYYQNKNTKPFKQNYGDFGQKFPHHIINPPSETYFKSLSRTPIADELTGNFAEQLVVNEGLGKSNSKTDYLGVSFSAVDAIGHQFGPNSLEAEDNLLQLDKTLSHLFISLDKEVGLENILIILTADHGVSDSPSFLKANHIPEAKPIDYALVEQDVRQLLNKQYALPEQALMSVNPPYIYLDHQIINNHKLDLAQVSKYIASALSQNPGIFRAYALPVTDIEKDWLSAKVDRMSYPYRAGDIYMVQPPYQFHKEKTEDKVSHGTPWQYDSHVPLLFVNANFTPQIISRPVSTTDIAPTLSALLVVKYPSGTVGEPLNEVLREFKKLD
jgi:predicted AlkP superfamily pyrophosphatase or phosphodiesterase